MDDTYYERLDDLKKIKKEYGENMAHMCREFFSTILEKPGLLYYIISNRFAKSKILYEDIVKGEKVFLFKNYIYSIYDEIISEHNKVKSNKSVRQLLSDNGYTLYECKTNEDIQKFRKYYAPGEELCTFNDPYRVNKYFIFFIVKDNADKLDRKLFVSPQREDEYSLSVLDLQFDKGGKQRVSIKSRYNHVVSNPDATHSNNLENIAQGLTEAFEREYDFNIGNDYKYNFELDGYVMANDNKYYKYNYEINNIYYCNNNIIIDNGEVINTYSDKSRYTFMDYFILDEVEKKIILYDEKIEDCFIDGFDNITNVLIVNDEGYKKILFSFDEGKEAVIILDNCGRIIGYCNNNLLRCGDGFLYYNKTLASLKLPKLQRCGNGFLRYNISIDTLNIPNLQECGYSFFSSNNIINNLNLPHLRKCGDFFLRYNKQLNTLNLPNLQECGDDFLERNSSLKNLHLPLLQRCEDGFLEYNNSLENLNLPLLQRCGDNFLECNGSLKNIYLPELRECGSFFLLYLSENKSFKNLHIPNLQVIDGNSSSDDNTLGLTNEEVQLNDKSEKNDGNFYNNYDNYFIKSQSNKRSWSSFFRKIFDSNVGRKENDKINNKRKR